MTFWPGGFDPRDEAAAVLSLVSIDTEDGVFRFMLGGDGKFRDVESHIWIGSQLIGGSDLRASIQGEAPAGQLTFTFIPDPEDGGLISEMLALGTDYIRGREISFWVQPLNSIEEMFAPVYPPIRWLVRKGAHIEFNLSGALERSITAYFEGPFSGRNTAPGLHYTTSDHARMIGEPNSSLRFMPTKLSKIQPLFGS